MIFKVDTATDPTLRLKLVTILVGLIDVIIGAVGSCGMTNDVYFLVTVLVIFSLSLLHLLCTVLDIFKTNCTSRGMDFLFHMMGGILILVTSIILVSGTNPKSCGVMEKTSAATIGIFNSLIYLYICYLVLRLLRQKDTGSLLPMYIFCACSRSSIDFVERDPQLQKQTGPPVSIMPSSRTQLFSAQKIHTPETLNVSSRNSETPVQT
ncbi:hypothetical protein Ocin01_12420 [Orchesella cincta]|uniref:MARVEL domain-containing protein n=1 Tax=Orchesella cincta TaxID=48709 RepID=A0A1D2MMH2_ORCCI|nr:hypothetical protein Ocin01_12420 [Orchesella cincta]